MGEFNMPWQKRPAIVRHIGTGNQDFTFGKQYEAFFLEYWQGERNSLHVRNDSGVIFDFNPFEDFEVIADEDNVLNLHEAIVRCRTHKYDDMIDGLRFGKEYKAIGRDKDGLYLVMDESYDCYFYPADIFDIVSDEHDILSHRSVYYNFKGQDVK